MCLSTASLTKHRICSQHSTVDQARPVQGKHACKYSQGGYPSTGGGAHRLDVLRLTFMVLIMSRSAFTDLGTSSMGQGGCTTPCALFALDELPCALMREAPRAVPSAMLRIMPPAMHLALAPARRLQNVPDSSITSADRSLKSGCSWARATGPSALKDVATPTTSTPTDGCASGRVEFRGDWDAIESAREPRVMEMRCFL
jgi:hypothetical protein